MKAKQLQKLNTNLQTGSIHIPKDGFVSIYILKIIAFIFIFLYHNNVADYMFSRYAVCMFFVISGFMNWIKYSGSLGDDHLHKPFRFAANKIKFIYPIHFFMTVVALFLHLYSCGEMHFWKTPQVFWITVISTISNLLLVSDWLPHYGRLMGKVIDYNIVIWFLSVMVLLYIFTPLFIKCLNGLISRSNNVRRSIFNISLVIYLFVLVENLVFLMSVGNDKSFYLVYQNPTTRVGDYLLGMLMGALFQYDMGGLARNRRWGLLLGFISSLATILMPTFIGPDFSSFFSSGSFLLIPVCCLTVSLVSYENEIRTAIGDRLSHFLSSFGKLTAVAFLVHVPIINAVHGVYRRVTDVNVLIWLFVSFSLSIFAAYTYSRCMIKIRNINAKR